MKKAFVVLAFVGALLSVHGQTKPPVKPAPAAADQKAPEKPATPPKTAQIDHADTTELKLAQAEISNLQLQFQVMQAQMQAIQSTFSAKQAEQTALHEKFFAKYKISKADGKFSPDFTSVTGSAADDNPKPDKP